MRVSIPGRAVPWKAPDVVRRRRRDGTEVRVGIKPDATRIWQARVRLAAARVRPVGGLLRGALELEATFFLHMPVAWSAWKAEAAWRELIRPTARPDSTNLLKALEDALNGLLWEDDAQVTDSHARRRYCLRADEERVELVVREVALGGDATREDLAAWGAQ